MLELSIAAVVIAAVAWDAFRRYLASIRWGTYFIELLSKVDVRIAAQDERLDAMEKKVNQTATELGAISITDMNRRGR